jgi:hypothetical protein
VAGLQRESFDGRIDSGGKAGFQPDSEPRGSVVASLPHDQPPLLRQAQLPGARSHPLIHAFFDWLVRGQHKAIGFQSASPQLIDRQFRTWR